MYFKISEKGGDLFTSQLLGKNVNTPGHFQYRRFHIYIYVKMSLVAADRGSSKYNFMIAMREKHCLQDR
jgi:hypothetical protein